MVRSRFKSIIAGAALLTTAQVFAGCGRSQSVQPIRAGLTSGGHTLEIVPNGYQGSLCVDGVGCGTVFDMAAGNYTLSAPSSTDIDDPATRVLGPLTVNGDGSVTVADNSPLFRHFTWNAVTSTLTPVLVEVAVDFAQFTGQQVSWLGHAGLSANSPPTKFIVDRKYGLIDGASRSMPMTSERNHYSAQGYGVTVRADGVSLDEDTGRSFRVDGADRHKLIARTHPVQVNLDRFTGQNVSWFFIAGVPPGISTVHLIDNRRYALLDTASKELSSDERMYSNAAYGVGVNPDGIEPRIVADNDMLESFSLNENVLTAKLRDVTVNFNGFTGDQLSWFSVAGLSPTSPATPLIVGRRYALIDTGSRRTNSDGNMFSSADYGVRVHRLEIPAGQPPVTLDDDTARSFDVAEQLLTAKVKDVSVLFNGFAGQQMNWYRVGAINASSGPVRLIAGRKYALRHEDSWAPASDDKMYSLTGYGVSVHGDGETPPPPAPVTLDEGTARSFLVSGMELAVRPARVTLTPPAGYSGTLCVRDAACGPPGGVLEVNVVAGRRYQIQGGGQFTVPTMGACTPDTVAVGNINVTVACDVTDPGQDPPGPDGGAGQPDAPPPGPLFSGPVRLDMSGYTSGVCVAGIECKAGSVASPLIQFNLPAGTHRLFDQYIFGTSGAEGSSNLGHLTVHPDGSWEPEPDLAPYFFAQGQGLKAITTPVRLKYNGFAGSIHLLGLGELPRNEVTVHLLANRGFELVTFGGTDPGDGGWKVAPGSRLKTSATGFTLDPGLQPHFLPHSDPAMLNLKVVPLVVSMNHYRGELAFESFRSCSGETDCTVPLMAGRRYVVNTPWAAPLTGAVAYNPLVPNARPLLVHLSGSVQLEGALADYFIQDDAHLTLNTVPVKFDLDGYVGPLGWYYNLFNGPGVVTEHLLVNRRYSIGTNWARALLPDEGSGFSSSQWSLQVRPGPVLEIDEETKRSFYPPANGVLKARTAEVNLGYRGHPFGIGARGIDGFNSTTGKVKLLAGRRYDVMTEHSVDELGESTSLGGESSGYGLWVEKVDEEGTQYRVGGSPSTRARLSLPGGTNIAVKTSRVTISPNGYPGALCLAGGTCTMGVPLTRDLMIGRRYQIQDAMSGFTVRAADGSCSPNQVTIAGYTLDVSCTLVPEGPADTGPRALAYEGEIIRYVPEVFGGGNPDPDVVIRDDIRLPVGTWSSPDQFDTFTGFGERSEDWIGYQFTTNKLFSRVDFQEGMNFWDGGWFDSLTVQVRQDDVWVNVPNLHSTPTYSKGATFSHFESYQLDFDSIVGDAIRIHGVPGGSERFISVGELAARGEDRITAKAGPDRVVSAGDTVILDGRASSTPGATPLNYLWTQTAGTPVTLIGPGSATPSFTAPAESATPLAFALVVSDGLTSSIPDTVRMELLGPGVVDLTALGAMDGTALDASGGLTTIEVIRDGVQPPLGSASSLTQFDTYSGAFKATETIGYKFTAAQEFSMVDFQEGRHFWDGGWFQPATLKVQVLSGGSWSTVSNLQVTPLSYHAGGLGDPYYESFRMKFDPIVGTAIRLSGTPAGEMTFISIGELRVFGRPLGDGAIQILAHHTEKCLEIDHGTGEANQQSCSPDSPSQHFLVRQLVAGNMLVSAQNYSRCLRVNDGPTTSGAAVSLSQCSSTPDPSQLWDLVADGRHHLMRSRSGQLCAEVVGGAESDAAPIRLATCAPGTDHQRWDLRFIPEDDCAHLADGTDCSGSAVGSPRTCVNHVCTAAGLIQKPACRVANNHVSDEIVYPYENTNHERNIETTVGVDNQFREYEPGKGRDRGQPRLFRPGKGAFRTVLRGATDSWTLLSGTIFASATTPPCTRQFAGGVEHVVVGGDWYPIGIDANGVVTTSTRTTWSASSPRHGGEVHAAGPTPATFTVDHNGAATYSVPIFLPPGLGGFTPRKLAINYNSQAGNGLLGVGFFLTGTSKIERCPRDGNFADADTGPVEFDEPISTGHPYGLCLDGRKLIPEGTAAVVSTYRVFDDRSIQVRVKERDGSGPIAFEVIDGNGNVNTYGHSDDSRVRARTVEFEKDRTGLENSPYANDPARRLFLKAKLSEGTKTLSWALSQSVDRFGSTAVYTYKQDVTPETVGTQQGGAIDQRLDRINYGGTEVKLDYQPRTDKIDRFVRGVHVVTGHVLTSIEIKTSVPGPVKTARKYQFGYEAQLAPLTRRSRLSTIKECDGNGVCKAPLQFKWQEQSPDFMRPEGYGIPLHDFDSLAKVYSLQVADLNNDGRDDIILRQGTEQAPTWSYALSNGNGFDNLKLTDLPPGILEITPQTTLAGIPIEEPWVSKQKYTIYNQMAISDLDGDGKPEIGLWTETPLIPGFPFMKGGFKFFNLDTGDGHKAPSSLPLPEHVMPFLGDLNADGLPEIISKDFARGVWRMNVNNPAIPGHIIGAYDISKDVIPDLARSMFVDADGDGRVELLAPTPNNNQFYGAFSAPPANRPLVYSGYGQSWMQPPVGGSDKNRAILADLNGDGLTDHVNAFSAADGSYVVPADFWLTFFYGQNTGTGFLRTPTQDPPVLDRGNGPTLPALTAGVGGIGLPPSVVQWCVGPSRETCTMHKDFVDNGVRVVDLDGDGRQELLVMGLPIACHFGREEPSLYNHYWRNDSSYAYKAWNVTTAGGAQLSCRETLGDPTLGTPYVVRQNPDRTWTKELLQGIDFAPPVVFEPHHPERMKQYGAKLSAVLDIDGDGIPEIIQPRAMADWAVQLQVYRRRVPKKADLLAEITDSLSAKTTIEYGPLSDSALHSRAEGCSYPIGCPRKGRWLVSKVTRDTSAQTPGGETIRAEERHTYAGARVDLFKKAWLGFATHTVIEPLREATTTYNFLNSTREGKVFPFAGLVEKETRDVVTGTKLIRLQRQWTRENSSTSDLELNLRLTSVCERRHEIPKPPTPPPGGWSGMSWGAAFAEVCSDSSQFDYYNYPRVTVKRGGIDKRTTTTTYRHIQDPSPTPPRRILGFPLRVSETSTVNGVESAPRVTEYEPDQNGMVVKETIEPSRSGTLHLETTYVRDGFGQPTLTTVTGMVNAPNPGTGLGVIPILTSRTTWADYDLQGNLRLTINSEGHRQESVRDPSHGGVVAQIDANGLMTRTFYDGFGRPVEIAPPTGASTFISYQFGSANGFGHYNVEKRTQRAGTVLAWETAYHDSLGQPWATASLAPRERTRWVFNLYDGLNRLTKVSAPLFDPEADVNYSIRSFDGLDRLVDLYEPDGNHALHIDYAALTSTATNGMKRRQVVARDATGLPTSSQTQDEYGNLKGQVILGYRQFGQVETVTKEINGRRVILTYGYDHLGRRTGTSDPDRGSFELVPNAFGEMVYEKDPAGAVAAKAYDTLSRPIVATNSDGASIFSYDLAPNGVGAMNWSRSPEGIATTRTFDEFSRPVGDYVVVPDAAPGGGAATFATESWYDDAGRLQGTRYPQATEDHGFEVNYHYSPSAGAVLDAVTDGAGKTFWQAEDFSLNGEVAQEWYGSGFRSRFQFDPVSSLLDGITGGFVNGEAADETVTTLPGLPGTLVQDVVYGYDGTRSLFGRIDRGQALGQGTALMVDEEYHYDDFNRLSKWFVSVDDGAFKEFTYNFDDYGNLTSRTTPSGEQPWAFVYAGSRPHTVTASTVGGITRAYQYDHRGRRYQDGPRTVTYNWFDLPKKIEQGASVLATFEYDAAGTRIRKRAGGVETITVGLYERTGSVSAPQGAKHTYRVQGPGRIVAEIDLDFDGTLLEERYVHAARQGSVELITKANQEYVRQRYEPYGNAVTPGDPLQPTMPSVRGGTRRGFTGHEHDDELGYVNMKGRIYDPVTASFLSPDPIIPKLGWAHAFHPYMYVLNNPVNLNDPTGFEPADAGAPPESGSSGVPAPVGAVYEGTEFTIESVTEEGVPYDVTLSPIYKTDEQGNSNLIGYRAKSIQPHRWVDANKSTCWASQCSGSYGMKYQSNYKIDQKRRENFGTAIETMYGWVGPTDLKSFALFALLPAAGKIVESALANAGTSTVLKAGGKVMAGELIVASGPKAGMAVAGGSRAGGLAIIDGARANEFLLANGAKGGGATVDLYRAVGEREFNSVMSTGKFLPGGNSLEGRQFAFSMEEALKYADTDVSKVAILKATVRQDAMPAFDFSKSIDPHIFKNGVVTVQPGAQSQIFHKNLVGVEHAY
jgi:RHS repeat-associated protein